MSAPFFFFLTTSQITHEHIILGVVFKTGHHTWEYIFDFVNFACEQLIGHRVLISEEENYQKQVLIILVVITEIQGQALYEKINCLILHTCSTPRLIFNKDVNMSVFFFFHFYEHFYGLN